MIDEESEHLLEENSNSTSRSHRPITQTRQEIFTASDRPASHRNSGTLLQVSVLTQATLSFYNSLTLLSTMYLKPARPAEEFGDDYLLIPCPNEEPTYNEAFYCNFSPGIVNAFNNFMTASIGVCRLGGRLHGGASTPDPQSENEMCILDPNSVNTHRSRIAPHDGTRTRTIEVPQQQRRQQDFAHDIPLFEWGPHHMRYRQSQNDLSMSLQSIGVQIGPVNLDMIRQRIEEDARILRDREDALQARIWQPLGYHRVQNRRNESEVDTLLRSDPVNAREIRTEKGNRMVVIPVKPRQNQEEVECTICQGEVSKSEADSAVLECLHWFHAECFEIWGKINPTCPCCKAEVIVIRVTTAPEEVAEPNEYTLTPQHMSRPSTPPRAAAGTKSRTNSEMMEESLLNQQAVDKQQEQEQTNLTEVQQNIGQPIAKVTVNVDNNTKAGEQRVDESESSAMIEEKVEVKADQVMMEEKLDKGLQVEENPQQDQNAQNEINPHQVDPVLDVPTAQEESHQNRDNSKMQPETPVLDENTKSKLGTSAISETIVEQQVIATDHMNGPGISGTDCDGSTNQNLPISTDPVTEPADQTIVDQPNSQNLQTEFNLTEASKAAPTETPVFVNPELTKPPDEEVTHISPDLPNLKAVPPLMEENLQTHSPPQTLRQKATVEPPAPLPPQDQPPNEHSTPPQKETLMNAEPLSQNETNTEQEPKTPHPEEGQTAPSPDPSQTNLPSV